jgi:hypothetical protein
MLHYECTFVILQTILHETFFQLESPSNSLNHQTADTFATSHSIGDSEFNYNMEESGNVTDNQSKNMKPTAGRETPVNWNKTNGDTLIRKLFDTPDSKEPLIQTPLKVNLYI